MSKTTTGKQTTKLLTCVFEDNAPLPSVKRLTLADGLYLGPLPKWLLAKDDDYHVMAVRPQFAQFFDSQLHKTTLNVEFTGRSDQNYEGINSGEADAQRKIDRYLLASLICEPRFLAPYASFVTIPHDERVCHSDRMRDFGHVENDLDHVLSQADFARIDRTYMALAPVLTNGATGRLPTALRYYQQAFRADIDTSVRFLGMMMAMESLFSHGASEISHQVSERTAFFLRASSDDREALYDEMRNHYSMRSTIAHGGTLAKAAKNLGQSFHELLLVLREALATIIADAALTTFFNSASSKQFGEALRSLVFRGKLL